MKKIPISPSGLYIHVLACICIHACTISSYKFSEGKIEARG